MEDKVLEIVVQVCDTEQIRENKDIDLLENDLIDSLAFITLIERLEEEFDIEIPDNDAEKVVTVGDVVDYLKENL